jgi:exosortase/archaeosortase family protein
VDQLNAASFRRFFCNHQSVDWVGVTLAAMLGLPALLMHDAKLLSFESLPATILALTSAWLLVTRLSALRGNLHPVVDNGVAILLAGSATLIACGAPLLTLYGEMMVLGAVTLALLSVVSFSRGYQRLSAVVVPVTLLYFALPLLPILEATLSFPMRRLSALFAAGLLSVGAETVSINGTEILMGDLTVSVTSACSGLNMLQHIAWIAWWSLLLNHSGAVERFCHVLLILPAVLIANTLRITCLALWASWSGPEVLATAGHAYVSWIAVALATALFLGMQAISTYQR